MKITININNKQKIFDISAVDTLLTVLRNNHYKDVKCGCEEGECGACLVLLNGKAINSCQVLAGSVDGSTIMTTNGIGTQQNPHIIQTSLAEAGAVQCGFCTPGIVISAFALLEQNKNPSEQDIRQALDGNLCRCTGYEKIIDGIQLAASRMKQLNTSL